MRTGDRAIAAALLVLTVAAGVLSLVDAGLVGVLTILAFVVLAPGWVIASRLKLAGPSLVWSVSAGVGIAITIAIAAVMVLAGLWYPDIAMAAFAAATGVALLRRLR